MSQFVNRYMKLAHKFRIKERGQWGSLSSINIARGENVRPEGYYQAISTKREDLVEIISNRVTTNNMSESVHDMRKLINLVESSYTRYNKKETQSARPAENQDEKDELTEAYISREEVAAIRAALKKEFGNTLKFSVTNDRHTAINVSIMAGDVDFSSIFGDKPPEDWHVQINNYHIDNLYPEHADLLKKILNIIKTAPATAEGGHEWFDKSDSMTDYFHTAFYISLNIGKWDSPYIYRGSKKTSYMSGGPASSSAEYSGPQNI